MAILVKGEITITKGFKTWKEMVYAQDGKLKEHGIKFVFAEYFLGGTRAAEEVA